MPDTHDAQFMEIKRDSSTAARAGLLTINGYKIKTPVLWLGHNFKGPVCLWKEKQVRVPGVLVNAFEILEMPTTAQSVNEKGINGHLGYRGPVMMDSGGFLFQKNSNMTVRPSKIMDFYEKANIDIGVTLDHPLNPSLSTSENKKRWERTLRNTEVMISNGNSYAFMPVIHGYTLNTLKDACRQIRHFVGKPSLIGIGSLVPLMKTSYLRDGFQYQRSDGKKGNHITFISDALKLVHDEFPNSFLHIFGVGGITTALSVFALGADSVDSVAWRLKAAYGAIQLPGISDRFLSPRPDSPRIRLVIQGHEADILADCNCPVCSAYQRLSWQKRHLDGSFKARTVHNGWTFLEEVRAFRKAILAGKGRTFIAKRLSKTHRFFSLFVEKK